MKDLFIKNIKIGIPVILAPMAGITNFAYRKLLKEQGCPLVVTEMVSDFALHYGNKETINMLKSDDIEKPLIVQLFGGTKESLLLGVNVLNNLGGFEILDINLGCPVNKVVKAGSGSSLLKEPEKIYQIVKSLKENTNKPITIKIRAGWDHDNINCDIVGRLAEKAGVDAIAIHTRTKSMLYRGNANIEYIKKIRTATNCFLIGNGDIKTTEDVKAYLEAGCDAVMIGRAALGNPWIFEKIKKELSGEEFIEPTPQEIIDTVLLHAKRLIELINERVAIVEMRTHAVWYFKKLPNSKQHRLKLIGITTYQELEDICKDYLNTI